MKCETATKANTFLLFFLGFFSVMNSNKYKKGEIIIFFDVWMANMISSNTQLADSNR